ncbi:ThiF family adenylyltransferase [Cohnella phaseoli]|uniref:Adenylyltransferase/sulfurtransferase n=1 Tax=Cohnella phaseoli TaxID=456490 RepID=A0A3D9IXK3_9BACL|nr:ThiF family adenylyltransferase [Cohnella phaseoli]RED66445.1 adenylyltransferase/sulfurtransferase [Cohnella phaseoli]
MLREAETEAEERYSQQIRFAPIGAQGQRRLGEASVLVVGAGALGASLAQHMVRAGVGRLRLVDRDYVELSNLHRQTLYDEEDAEAALPKAVAAAAKLRRVNGRARIEAFVADVDRRNAESLAADVDLVLDGTDNAATRLLLSDACFSRGIPLVYGGVAGSGGMTALLVPGDHCCLRCLLGEEAPGGEDGPTCDTLGVISPAVEMVAALQAAEALKALTGNRSALRGTWLTVDAWHFSVKEWKLPPPVEPCPYCGWGESAAAARRELAEHGDSFRLSANGERAKEQNATEAALLCVRRAVAAEDVSIADRSESATGNALFGDDREAAKLIVLCGRDTFQLALKPSVSLSEWRRRLVAAGCAITADNRYLLRASTAAEERIVIFAEGRALIQGAGEPERAMEIYRHYLSDGTGREADETSVGF